MGEIPTNPDQLKDYFHRHPDKRSGAFAVTIVAWDCVRRGQTPQYSGPCQADRSQILTKIG
jgi:hypothetical protein